MKILVTFFLLFSLSFAKEVSDMLGRNITVPVHVDRAFSASPPMMVLLYTLSPQTLIVVNYNFLPVEQSFMLPSVR